MWTSTNVATSIAKNVRWTAVTDDQATLSIGSIAIQPGNSNSKQSVILVGTGEADNAADYADTGSQESAKVSLTPSDSGSITASCDATAFAGQCSVTPSATSVSPGTAVSPTLTLNVPNSAAPNPSNSYTVGFTVADSSGQPSQTLSVPITVIQDFDVGSLTSASQTIYEGQSANYNFSVLPVGASFTSAVTFSCAGDRQSRSAVLLLSGHVPAIAPLPW